MLGAIPPLPQYAFMAWRSVKAQGKLYLYIKDILYTDFCTMSLFLIIKFRYERRIKLIRK